MRRPSSGSGEHSSSKSSSKSRTTTNNPLPKAYRQDSSNPSSLYSEQGHSNEDSHTTYSPSRSPSPARQMKSPKEADTSRRQNKHTENKQKAGQKAEQKAEQKAGFGSKNVSKKEVAGSASPSKDPDRAQHEASKKKGSHRWSFRKPESLDTRDFRQAESTDSRFLHADQSRYDSRSRSATSEDSYGSHSFQSKQKKKLSDELLAEQRTKGRDLGIHGKESDHQQTVKAKDPYHNSRRWKFGRSKKFDINKAILQATKNTQQSTVNQNQTTIILGQKGSGKSTIFRHILDRLDTQQAPAYSGPTSSSTSNRTIGTEQDKEKDEDATSSQKEENLEMLQFVLPYCVDMLAMLVNQDPLDSPARSHPGKTSTSNIRVLNTVRQLFRSSETNVPLVESKPISILQEAMQLTKLPLGHKESPQMSYSFETDIRELLVELRWVISWMKPDAGFAKLHRNVPRVEKNEGQQSQRQQQDQDNHDDDDDDDDDDDGNGESVSPAEVLNDCRWDIVRLFGDEQSLNTLMVMQYRFRPCAHLSLILESVLTLIDRIVPDETAPVPRDSSKGSGEQVAGSRPSALNANQLAGATKAYDTNSLEQSEPKGSRGALDFMTSDSPASTATTTTTATATATTASVFKAPNSPFVDTITREAQEQLDNSESWSLVTQSMLENYLSMVRRQMRFGHTLTQRIIFSRGSKNQLTSKCSIRDLSHSRSEWYKHIPNANCVAFVFGLDRLIIRRRGDIFSCTTFRADDPIGEALADFYSICSSPYLKQTKFLVVLNKLDILTRTIGASCAADTITQVVQNVAHSFKLVFQKATAVHHSDASPGHRINVITGSCPSTLLPESSVFTEIINFLEVPFHSFPS